MAGSKEAKSKVAKMGLPLPRQKLPQHRASRCVSILIKPLRIFQFFAVLLLFAFTIYMIAVDLTPISSLACILLIVLSGIYVFVLAVELISHFASGVLHIIPMCAFSLFGLAFFGTAGILLICYGYTQFIVQLATVILCLSAALFFLLDIAIVFVFWKRKCSVCRRCCNEGAEYLLRKDEGPHPSVAKIMKHDVTTSLSDVRIPVELKSVVTPDHGYRKVEYPRRREYVDCPTCVPSLCNLSIAQIQTEPCETSVMESQTSSAVVRETPMQTFSKCEFCQQFMQTAALPITEEAIRQYSQNLSQWFYPAIVQFIRGGIGMPCCRGCKCATGIAPQTKEQLPQPQRQSRPSPPSPRRKKSPAPAAPKPKTDKTSTSEATQQVTNSKCGTVDVSKLTSGIAQTVTRLTLASFYVKPDKKMPNNPVNPASERKVDTMEIRRENPTSQSDQELRKEIITMLAKGEEPAVIEEMIIKSIEGKRRDEESTERRNEELVEEVEYNGKAERSKGGGGGGEERRITTCHQFMRASEEGSVSNLKGSPMHTQISATLTSPLASSKTKPRTYLHLKSNKVDPIRDADASDENSGISETVTSRTFVSPAVRKDGRAESPNPIEHRKKDICSYCKSLKPTSANYCNIFKDKRGRYFCEFCAPTDKITSRLEVTDLKKLQCANCRLSLRARGVKTNIKLKSDACPKCGQSQRQTAASSPSSM